MKKNNQVSKVTRILAFSGWTQDKLADLLDVSNVIVNKWVRGKAIPKGERAEKVNKLFDELVAPYVCELEKKADAVEKEILERKIEHLADNNICVAE